MFASRSLLRILILVLGSALLLHAADRRPAPPDIILITLDTTRADKLGAMGSGQGLTPNLDGLAHDGIAFTRAFAHVPLTTPSHATILTGTYPQFNQVHDMGTALAKSLPFLPAILHDKGYETAAFIGSSVLDAKTGSAAGFDRGFDLYDADFHKRKPGEDRYHSVERRAGTVVDHAIAWLGRRHSRPVFVWVHLYDAHAPYDPPEPYKTRYASDEYDGEIAYADSQVGRLLKTLQQRNSYASSIVVAVADHGEAFGEHGEREHGVFLYDETLHVPLIVKLPAQHLAGTRVENRVGLVDIAPTILEAAGLPIPDEMQGKSLTKRMSAPAAAKSGENSGDESIYSESEYGHNAFGWSPLHSWRSGKYLYIQAPRRELYNQLPDPRADHNLAAQSNAISDTMASQLDSFRRKTASGAVTKSQMDPAAAEQLRALGYVSSSGVTTHAAGESDPDPKDHIELANLMHEGLINIEDEQLDAAISKLESAVKIEPKFGTAYLELGNVLLQNRHPQDALAPLGKAVELMPESPPAHERLGLALAETQNWVAAVPQLEEALARNPKSADWHMELGGVYEHLQRMADAGKQYQAAVTLAPDDFRANLLVGRVLGMQGNAAAALPYLQAAASLDPLSPDAHQFLGNIYKELGQTDDAAREHAEAKRLRSQTH
jgi:arylsulfatase A-like enzyme/cytochrome c-type biogenesis protein CcmH/NrfG